MVLCMFTHPRLMRFSNQLAQHPFLPTQRSVTSFREGEFASPEPRPLGMAEQPSTDAQLALALQKNKELVSKLRTLRGEVASPDDAGSAPSMSSEVLYKGNSEVYARQPGLDALSTGLSKRTPCGAFFTS